MFTLAVENANGERLTLTQNEQNYQLYSVEGLMPPKANISTSSVVNRDGVKVKSAKVQERNIVLNIRLNGDIEANRIRLYTFFKSGKYCKLYYKNATRDIYCEGYVESINGNLFSKSETVQVSILIPYSYLTDANALRFELSRIFREFEFPFSINAEGAVFSELSDTTEVMLINRGDVDTGLIITITATDDGVVNPIIYNTDTMEFIKVNTTLNKGDRVVINTNIGKKSVKKYVGKAVSNILGDVDSGSTWLTLRPGNNSFWFNCDEGALDTHIQFDYNNYYEGV